MSYAVNRPEQLEGQGIDGLIHGERGLPVKGAFNFVDNTWIDHDVATKLASVIEPSANADDKSKTCDMLIFHIYDDTFLQRRRSGPVHDRFAVRA